MKTLAIVLGVIFLLAAIFAVTGGSARPTGSIGRDELRPGALFAFEKIQARHAAHYAGCRCAQRRFHTLKRHQIGVNRLEDQAGGHR